MQVSSLTLEAAGHLDLVSPCWVTAPGERSLVQSAGRLPPIVDLELLAAACSCTHSTYINCFYGLKNDTYFCELTFRTRSADGRSRLTCSTLLWDGRFTFPG